jgi:hypothetical protein
MSPDTLESATTHRSRGILWLVVAHVAVGVIAALLVKSIDNDYGLAWDVISGVFFSQTSLLGVWCALGTSRHWKRLMGGILGVGLLYLMTGLASGDWDIEILVIVSAYTAFTAIPLLVARACRIAIQDDSSSTTVASHHQFFIRDLLALTFVVACMIALGKVLRPLILEGFSTSELVFYATLLILFGVVSTYLILASKRPVSYGIGLIVMSACSGYCLELFSIFDWSASGMTAFTATSMSVVVVSLLLVRRCGYRLVQLRKSTARGSGLEEITTPQVSDQDSQSSSLSK